MRSAARRGEVRPAVERRRERLPGQLKGHSQHAAGLTAVYFLAGLWVAGDMGDARVGEQLGVEPCRLLTLAVEPSSALACKGTPLDVWKRCQLLPIVFVAHAYLATAALPPPVQTTGGTLSSGICKVQRVEYQFHHFENGGLGYPPIPNGSVIVPSDNSIVTLPIVQLGGSEWRKRTEACAGRERGKVQAPTVSEVESAVMAPGEKGIHERAARIATPACLGRPFLSRKRPVLLTAVKEI